MLHNPYFFQMPVTTATQTANLVGRINVGLNSKLTLFSDASGSEEPYRRSILAAINSAGLPYNEIRYHIVSGRTIIDSLLTIMSPDVEHNIVVASEQEAFASDVIRNMGVLKFHGYNIKVYCSNKIRNFETIEELCCIRSIHIFLQLFVDYKEEATRISSCLPCPVQYRPTPLHSTDIYFPLFHQGNKCPGEDSPI